MCNIGTIGLGLQGASVIANLSTNNQESSAYANYQIAQSQSTLYNYIEQTKAINNRYIEEQEAASMENQEVYIQNLQRQATAQASAAGAGIEGSTIDTLFRNYDRATAVSNYTSAKNLRMKGLQYNDELESLKLKAIGSIRGQKKYTGADPIFGLLAGAGTMLSGYTDMKIKQEQLHYYKQFK